MTEDPGPQATVRALAEIWMVTCGGRLERTRRILLSRDWESLDDEIVGPMPASLTTARYRMVAGWASRNRSPPRTRRAGSR